MGRGGKALAGRQALRWVAGTVVWAAFAAHASAQAGNDLRDLRVGMLVSELPPHGYIDLACQDGTDRKLPSWNDWSQCAATSAQQYWVSFKYDSDLSDLARVNDNAEGTKVAGHPVRLALLVDAPSSRVAALKIETDLAAPFFMKKKAHLLGGQVKSRFGIEGWKCADTPPDDERQPVGGMFVDERCVKSGADRRLTLQTKLLRMRGSAPKEIVSSTVLTIESPGLVAPR
jgi:hypothetical protein